MKIFVSTVFLVLVALPCFASLVPAPGSSLASAVAEHIAAIETYQGVSYTDRTYSATEPSAPSGYVQMGYNYWNYTDGALTPIYYRSEATPYTYKEIIWCRDGFSSMLVDSGSIVGTTDMSVSYFDFLMGILGLLSAYFLWESMSRATHN